MRHRIGNSVRKPLSLSALAFVAMALPAYAQQAAVPPASAPQAQATGSAPASSTANVPVTNRLNEVLPSWLRVRGEFRERVEGVSNAGFNASRDDLYYLSRFRFNATATSKYVAGTVQVQDARVGKKTVGPTGAPFKAAFDVRQAFVDLGTAKSRVAARLGRQELAFGDQRLIGPLNWTNAGRSFDAARVTVKSAPLQVDLFAASVVRIMDGEFDKSGNGHRLAGAYLTAGKLVPKGSVEPYVFWRRDVNLLSEARVPGTLSQVTSGARLAGRLPASLDYNVEMSLQTGSLGPDTVRAWAGHWQVRRSFTGKWAPHVTGEYNLASGDASPTDGTRGTFDQLYPTAHDKYGLADQVGWRNIHDVRAGFDVSPFKATLITVNYHSYWLGERRDALYSAGGAAVARVAAGAASTRVGQELDVQIARPFTAQIGVAAGYSHLCAGPFLKEATPGQSYRGPFVMLTYVLLAEK